MNWCSRDEAFDPALTSSFLAGYETVRRLTVRERQALPLMLLSRIARRCALTPGEQFEDAALRVESGSETFFVFRNSETEAVSILYRRSDGNYGLIEPD